MRKMYDAATKTPTSTGSALLRLLERRLDNVLFRMRFAPTRAAARQLVGHGHVQVNGKKMSIPSYLVSIDDQISLNSSAQKIPSTAQVMKDPGAFKEWVNVKASVGKIVRFPEREEIDGAIEEQLIVEWYSR